MAVLNLFCYEISFPKFYVYFKTQISWWCLKTEYLHYLNLVLAESLLGV